MTAQRLGRDLGRGAVADIGFAWALGLGIGLIALGLLGFVPNPLVGAPSPGWGTPLLLTGSAHDVLHLVAGAVVLYGALGLPARRRGMLLVGVGIVALVLFLVALIDGRWFGLVGYPVTLLDQVLLLLIGVVSVTVGYVAQGGSLGQLRLRRTPAATDDRAAADIATPARAGHAVDPDPVAGRPPAGDSIISTEPLMTLPRTPLTVVDRLDRPMRDLRISVTDRCNFRCIYCMPREVFGAGFRFLPRADLLTFEEIARLARLFVANGVTKLRLTGGEPLLRRDLPRLVELLAGIEGLDDLAMTTNGALLATHAGSLARAGLGRVTVSLDSLDDEVFGRLNDVGMSVGRVVEGIEAAEAAGLGPIKIDTVVRRGINEDSILPLAFEARRRGWVIRYIEYMDVGQTNGWRMEDVVSAADIKVIGRALPLEPVEPTYLGEVASRYRYQDGSGEVGVIASVTRPFCATCTRARLSAEGYLYLCLFGMRAHDLKGPMRSGVDDDALSGIVRTAWERRGDRYSEIRSEATMSRPRVEMSHIGG